MPSSFLLRFQEFCVEPAGADVRAGTGTSTRVRAEQADADAVGGGRSVIPLAGGTMTKTGIDTEQGGQDADRTEGQMRTFPRPVVQPLAQTQTATAVRAEAADKDPGVASMNAIPTCC